MIWLYSIPIVIVLYFIIVLVSLIATYLMNTLTTSEETLRILADESDDSVILWRSRWLWCLIWPAAGYFYTIRYLARGISFFGKFRIFKAMHRGTFKLASKIPV